MSCRRRLSASDTYLTPKYTKIRTLVSPSLDPASLGERVDGVHRDGEGDMNRHTLRELPLAHDLRALQRLDRRVYEPGTRCRSRRSSLSSRAMHGLIPLTWIMEDRVGPATRLVTHQMQRSHGCVQEGTWSVIAAPVNAHAPLFAKSQMQRDTMIDVDAVVFRMDLRRRRGRLDD